MRVFGHCAVAGCLAAAVAFSGATALGTSEPAIGSAAQSKDPAAILAAARQALGGDAKLSAVKSFTATGRTRQVRGDNLVPIEFEIFVELPDKYLRKDEVPAQESGPTATGFNGEEFLQDPPPAAPPTPPGGAGAAAPNPAVLEAARKARVTTVKQDFARLTLGMFAASFPTYPLTFTYVGEAEAPQGKADVIDAKGPNNFTLRLFVNQQNHLPIMVSWQGPAPGRGRGPGGPGMPGGAPPPGAGRGAAPAGAPGDRGAPPAGAARRVRAVLHLQASVGLQHRPVTEVRQHLVGRSRCVRLLGGECRPAEVPRARLHPRTGSTSPTIVTSTECSSPSGCAGPSGPTPSKRPPSIDSGSTPKSTRNDSRSENDGTLAIDAGNSS